MEEFQTTDVYEFLDKLKSFVARDVFDHEQNQLNFVGNAVLLDDSRYNGTLRKYAEALRNSGTYTACSGLARYYYLPKGQLDEVFAVSREAIAQEASAKDAWNLQFAFYRDEVLPAITEKDLPAFLTGVEGTAAYLEDFSQGRLEEIELSEDVQTFLKAVEEVQSAGMSDEMAYLYLLTLVPTGESAS